MNKRQRKKNEKKYLPIIADEYNLLTMTPEERKEAWSDYNSFRERYAYRKKYKNLKEGETLRYYFPIGKKHNNLLKNLHDVGSSKKHTSFVTITQNNDDLKQHFRSEKKVGYIKNIYVES